jgi:branched-chain amino acid aminotransferase
METVERDIDRTELYTSDECFMTGTAAHVTPVVELDRRPIGDARMGPVAGRLVKLYFEIIQGKNPKYAHWCTPCYSKVKA